MENNYTLKVPTQKSFFKALLELVRKMIVLMLVVGIAGTGFAQKNKPKGNTLKDITVNSCIQDLGNGLSRVNFSYNNPNDEVIVVSNGLSKLVIKKGNKKTTSFAINRFVPGEVANAFFVDLFEIDYVEWTLKNPGGTTKKSKADSNTAMCPESSSSVIIPVYGQEGGKSTTPIGLELTALAEGNAGGQPSNIVYQITGSGDAREVLLEIVPKTGLKAQVRTILETTFGRVYLANDALNTDFIVDPALVVNGELATFDVFFPINRLLELNNVASINFIRPLYTPILQQIGRVSTQGDGAMLTDAVRESFVLTRDEDGTPLTYVNGAGIKIGVISDSFDKQPASEGQSKATADVSNRDLPGTAGIGNPDYPTPVDVRKDYPYPGGSDEGRAMMHIIHDVAPGAELAFSTGILSPRDFALAIEDLALAGCDLIVDDVTYPFEPFFGEGQISKAIKDFTNGPGNEGHAYFTSAGNFANRGYQSVFKASTLSPVTNVEALDAAKAHVFNTGQPEDIFQGISVVPGTYMIVLQWDEPLASQDNGIPGATTDLDIFLVDDLGNFIVGNNRVNINGDAAEVLVFQATGTGTANILITSPTDPGPVPFRYIAFRTTSDTNPPTTGLQFTEYNGGAPTVSGHAMTLEARTVGAVFYQNASNPSAQPFSSFAGALTNTPAQVLQVDLAAPDGGNTNVDSIGQDDINGVPIDGDGFPNFFGTSAAAPHAAAAFALLQSAIPTWYPESGLPIEVGVTTNLTADQVLQYFKNTAVPAGPIETAGSGLIDAEAALGQIAAQTAVLNGFTVDEGQGEPIPGVSTYNVTITGKYIPTSEGGVSVLLGDQVLATVGTPTSTEITATVLPFTGNPQLTVLNNSELPGAGKSNGLPIVPDNKIVLNITADPVDIEFGQDYEFTYSVEGLTGEMTYEDTGLPEIALTSGAFAPFPDVDDYTIFIDFVDGERTEAELAALDTYQVNFIEGDFIVTKKDLLIQPLDDTITYGDPVDVILGYTYVNDGISPENDTAFLNVIKSAHNQDFFEENKLILINRFRAVVNEVDVLGLLNQGSWIGSDRTINNRFRAVVNGMDLIDLDISHFTDYDAAEEDPITNRFRAVVNRFRAVVNSTDLFGNQVDFDFGPEVPELNRFRAVVNGTSLGDENDLNDYNKVFAVIDEGDAPTEEDPDREISQFYALNLLSGLDVTPDTEGEEEDGRHYIFPGGFLNGLASNFNVTFGAGRLEVDAASLFYETPNLEIDFGVGITRAYLDALISPVPAEEGCEVCPEASLFFEGFEYDDTVETVFADPTCDPEELAEGELCPIVIPYYFENTETGQTFDISDAGEDGLMLPAGFYFIKIRDTKNYELDFGEGIGRLEVIDRVYTVSGNYDGDYTVEYGDLVFPEDIGPFVQIFKTGEDEDLVELDEGELEALFPDGIQYYLVDETLEDEVGEVTRYFLNDEEPPLLPYVGRFIVKISLPDEPNFELVYEDPLIVEVVNKVLIVRSIFYNYENPGNPYGIDYGQEITTLEWQTFLDNNIIFEDPNDGDVDLDNVFPPSGIVPYYLVDEDLEGTEVEVKYFLGDINDDDYLELPVGRYVVRVDMPESNYDLEYATLLIVEVGKKQLTFNADSFELEYGEEVFEEDIQKFDNPTESLISVFQGFAYEDNEFDLFDEAIPYVFELIGGEGEIPLGDRLVVGDYLIRIESGAADDLQNYEIIYDDGEEGVQNNVLTITKAELSACIDPEIPEIRAGDLITPAFLDDYFIINGYLYDDDQNNVFPGGVITYVLVEAGDETIIPTEGITLGEGIYTIRIFGDEDDEIDNYLDNYTVSGLACKSTIEVTKCGDAVILDFSNYTYDAFFGEYRFTDVLLSPELDLDALVTVQTRGTVQNVTIDQNISFDLNTDNRKQFRPSAGFNITSSEVPPYVEFSITLVNKGTRSTATVGKLIAGVLDVDGESGYKEYVEINLPSQYTVQGGANPTQLQVTEKPANGLLEIIGHSSSYIGPIFNGAPRGNVEVVYENVSSLIYRIGATDDLGPVPVRQFGIQFSCLTNFDPLSEPVTVEDLGSPMTETAAETECVVYNNPVGQANDYVLTLRPKEGISGEASVSFMLLGSTQSINFGFEFVSEEQPIVINMGNESVFANGLYIVQTNIGDCQSDGFIVIKKE